MKDGIRLHVRKRLRSARGAMDLELDLEVGAGERVAIFGPSGSGKSSVLRMVAGLMAPDEGRIEVGGEVWFDSSAKVDLPPHRRRPGLVFQDYALFPHRTAFQNILDGATGRGGRDAARAFVERFELSGVADHLPRKLSGGQSQRVALARTLASGPRTLLLDEPLSALDTSMRGRMLEEIARHLDEAGLPTILVSHDMGEVWRLAGRVVRLEEGKATAVGTPDTVFAGGHATPRLRIPATILSLTASEGFVVVTATAAGQIVRAAVSPAEAHALRPGQPVLLAAKAFETMVLPLEAGDRIDRSDLSFRSKEPPIESRGPT